MSTRNSSAWNKLCARLNVKPRQFAMLLLVTVAAGGFLAFKFLHSPRKAGASPAAARNPSAEAPAGAAPATAHSAAASLATGALPTVPVEFETRPLRDPFLPFFIYTPASGDAEIPESDGQGVLVAPRTGTAAGKGAAGAKGAPHAKTVPGAQAAPPPEGPQGIVLKAIIASRVAVLNGMSVEVGDVIKDEIGQTFTVAEIRERSLVLSDGQRRFAIGYAPAPLKAPKAGAKAPRK